MIQRLIAEDLLDACTTITEDSPDILPRIFIVNAMQINYIASEVAGIFDIYKHLQVLGRYPKLKKFKRGVSEMRIARKSHFTYAVK